MTLCLARASCAHRELVCGFCSKPRNSWPSKIKSTSRRRFFGVVRTGKVRPPSSTSCKFSTMAARQTVMRAFSRVIIYSNAGPKERHMDNSSLQSSEKEMPGGVHGGMDERRGEDGSGSAPRPAVENTSDGCKDHITPVRESQIGDVRKAKRDGGRPPTGNFALGYAGEQVLQQAPKEKLFGPRGEEENAQRGQRQGFPLPPLRFELHEVHAGAQGDGDQRESEKAGHNEKAPAAAPADGVTD